MYFTECYNLMGKKMECFIVYPDEENLENSKIWKGNIDSNMKVEWEKGPKETSTLSVTLYILYMKMMWKWQNDDFYQFWMLLYKYFLRDYSVIFI